MHPTRREMLRLGLGTSALLACGPTVPMFLARSAGALADDRPAAARGRILVVVQLDGGNDGLNTVEPFRRRLGVPEKAGPAAQAAALDRLARQECGEPGSLLQFVERCSLITYANSARLERLHQDTASAASGYPDFYGLARRLRLIAQ